MPIILIVAVLLTGGVTVAAENSVPGNLLYPVKIEVNESVRGALTLTAQGKAQWEADQAIRRLEEAAELSAEQKLDAQAKVDLENAFVVHEKAAEDRIVALSEDGDNEAAAEVSADFEARLKANADILNRLAQKSQPDAAGNVILRVNAAIGALGQLRLASEAAVGAQPDVDVAAQGAAKAARNKLDEAKWFIDRRSAQVSAEVKTKAYAKLDAAEHAYVAAQAKFDAKAYADAFIEFRSASRLAQEAQEFISGEQELEVKLDFDARSDFQSDVQEDNANDDDRDDARVDLSAGADAKADDNALNGRADGQMKIDLGY